MTSSRFLLDFARSEIAQEPSFNMYHSHSFARQDLKPFNGHFISPPPYHLIGKLYHNKRKGDTGMKAKEKRKPSQWKIEAGKSGGFSEEEVAFYEEILCIQRKGFFKGLAIGIFVAGALLSILFLL